MACRWMCFAYRLLPLPAWRAFLLDRHIDGCPACQSAVLDDAAIRSLGVTPDDLENEPPLFPFAAGSKARGRRPAFGWRWNYVYGVVLAAAILGTAVWISLLIPTATLPTGTVTISEAEDNGHGFAVLAARIGDESARPVVFKPGQPGVTIVWFEKIVN